MKVKILTDGNNLEKSITIIRIDSGYIHPHGWMFPCLICSSISSRIRKINTLNEDGIIKSIICKDCKKKNYIHPKPYSYYLKYKHFYRLKRIYQG